MGEANRRKRAGPAAAAPLPARHDAADLMAQARRLQQSGALADALALCWQVLRDQPGDAAAHQHAGQLLVQLGQAELGLHHLRQSTRLAPGNVAHWINLAAALGLGGDAQGALASLTQALHLDPGHAGALMQRAGLLEGLGQAGPAARAFLQAAAADPSNPLAHHGAAGQLYRLDRLPQAIACQQRAQALDPSLRRDGNLGFALAGPRPDPAPQVAALGQAAAGPAASTGDALAQALAACEMRVFDNFLADPLAWRGHALAQHYQDQNAWRQANFPGLQTAGDLAPAAFSQRIADALGRDLKWGWPGHGAFRISPAGSLARSDIHIDHGDSRVAYAGVLYLSLPQHCRGGTSFWRHRETGWSGAPSDQALRHSRWGSFANFMRAQAAGDSRRFDALSQGRDGWDLLFEMPMRFNRLIVYRSDFFHSISQVFGSGLADGRLTQLFFFEPLGPPQGLPDGCT